VKVAPAPTIFRLGGAPGAQQILERREGGYRITAVAVRRANDEDACLVLLQVLLHRQVLDQLLGFLLCALPLRVNDVGRRVRGARSWIVDALLKSSE
jgi:hypothetical protein